MPDVVFVTPNFNGFVREEPVGTLLLSTILHNAGIQAKILPFHQFGDVKNFDQFIDKAVNEVLAQNPAIVSFYTRCDTYHISITIAQRIKKARQNVYIVFGGPQADISSLDTIRAIPEVDYVCCGEGETTIVPFFSSLLSKSPNLNIAGLVYRKNYEIIQNPRPELIADLDTLPTIDYSLLDFQTADKLSHVKTLFPVDVGRGCPFSCTFCSTKTFWGRKYRLKSTERIIAEIKHIHELFGITSFNFEHDMFTMNRKRILHICDELVSIGFPITWRCSARLDCLDNELIDAMAAAGVEIIFTGIESGSLNMQKKIQKNLKLDEVFDKISYISSKNIKCTASFIFGFPEETEADFEQTIALMIKLCKLPRVQIQHHMCAFFSGTELTQRYWHADQMTSVFSDITGDVAVVECAELIRANPTLFPHYFEFRSELRDKAKFFPEFFECWIRMHPVYEYIALNYYDNHYCQMLYDFTSSNSSALSAGKSVIELLKEDRFLARFSDDPHYSLLREIMRFLIWKLASSGTSHDIFGFDVKALLEGKKISDINPTLTMVSYTSNSSGGKQLILRPFQ